MDRLDFLDLAVRCQRFSDDHSYLVRGESWKRDLTPDVSVSSDCTARHKLPTASGPILHIEIRNAVPRESFIQRRIVRVFGMVLKCEHVDPIDSGGFLEVNLNPIGMNVRSIINPGRIATEFPRSGVNLVDNALNFKLAVRGAVRGRSSCRRAFAFGGNVHHWSYSRGHEVHLRQL